MKRTFAGLKDLDPRPEFLGSFGSDGHASGQIRSANAIAVDSKGNIYTAEATDGRRVQTFTFKGM